MTAAKGLYTHKPPRLQVTILQEDLASISIAFLAKKAFIKPSHCENTEVNNNMHRAVNAQSQPGKSAFIVTGTDVTLTHGELDKFSKQGEQLIRDSGA